MAAGRQVGNTPQAFSHVGLVNTARHLSRTRPAHETGARTDGGDPEAPVDRHHTTRDHTTRDHAAPHRGSPTASEVHP